MRHVQWIGCFLVVSMSVVPDAHAWGAVGHQRVGAVADRLIKGTHAAARVQLILGGLKLRDAAVWADCVKGVSTATSPPKYTAAGKYPECATFETTSGKAAMVDFVTRNDTSCAPAPGEETCHKQYHYTDVAIAHDRYDRSFTGTRPHDITGAIAAATRFLKGEPVPAPFSFKNEREALLVLAHYVGDIHQPLHVGAVYLDSAGKRVDPDLAGFDPDTFTRGGNRIRVSGASSLHSKWDGLPAFLATTSALVTQAEAVPATTGPLDAWPQQWASESVRQAQAAFRNVTFGNAHGDEWTATLPAQYDSASRKIKKTQLARAGARLAQLLEAIWP